MDPREPDGTSARRRAAALFETGLTRASVARHLGLSRATSSNWYRLWYEGGVDALLESRPAGRRPKLEPKELSSVHRALMRPPREAGIDLDTWSLAAIALLIERSTGVRYHRRHLGRLLRRSGWVVPPVGPPAVHAFRRASYADPDGNELWLQEHSNL